MQEQGNIDWWKTLAIPASVIAAGVILRTAFWPLLERTVQKAMKPWTNYIRRNVRRIRRLRRDVDQLETEVGEIKAAQNLNANLDRLYATVEFLRERERAGHEERRRDGSPLMQGGRRKDDPPARER